MPQFKAGLGTAATKAAEKATAKKECLEYMVQTFKSESSTTSSSSLQGKYKENLNHPTPLSQGETTFIVVVV